MRSTGGFEVEYEDALAAGNAMLRVSDDVAAAGQVGVLVGARLYGGSVLPAAAGRFADRFTHLLVQGLAEEADAAGESLRATVRHYEETDILAPGLFPTATGPAFV